jgi:hypothetical protein
MTHTHRFMKGMSVAPTRHLADSLGKRAAEQFGSCDKDGSIREAMANLSAHSEQTSDAKYGNHAESMVFDVSGQDMDKYKLCARLFNDMVGITVPRESTPFRYSAGLMPTPPTKGRRVQTSPSTDILTQTTSGGFQWPPPCCGSLMAIDENASSVDYDGDVDLLWADLNQGLDDDKAAGQKRSAEKYKSRGSPTTSHALQRTSPALLLRSPSPSSNKRSPSSVTLNPSSVCHSSSLLSHPSPCLVAPASLGAVGGAPLEVVTENPSSVRHSSALLSHPSPCLVAPASLGAVGGAPLEVVTDFVFQANVMRLLSEITLKEGNSVNDRCGCLTRAIGKKSLLVIQPTASGKGAYAPAMAKTPSVAVLLLRFYCY